MHSIVSFQICRFILHFQNHTRHLYLNGRKVTNHVSTFSFDSTSVEFYTYGTLSFIYLPLFFFLADRICMLFLKFIGDLSETVKDEREDRRAGFLVSLLNADNAETPVKAEHPVEAGHQEKTQVPVERAGGTDHNNQSVSKNSFLFFCICLYLFSLSGIACGKSGRMKKCCWVLCYAADAYVNCLFSVF